MAVVAEKAYKDFVEKKINFFNDLPAAQSKNIDKAEWSFRFLSENLELFESEIANLIPLLKYDHATESLKKWGAYCCDQMQLYYGKDGYDDAGKAAKYRAHANAFRDQEDAKTNTIFEAFINSLEEDINFFKQAPVSASRLRRIVEWINIRRLQWVFLRKFLVFNLKYAHDAKMLEFLQHWFSIHIQCEKVTNFLLMASTPLNYLSVLVFIARFALSVGPAFKHIYLPNKKEEELTASERALKENWLRHGKFLNDILWALINMLCNFSLYFHISNPAVLTLTITFMGFDFALLLWRRHLAEIDYQFKKMQYNYEIAYWKEQFKDNYIDQKFLDERLSELEDLTSENEINWQVISTTFYFNAAAALLLATGFTGAMFFSAPILIVASWFVCVLAIAIYMSADDYSAYKNAQLHWEKFASNPQRYNEAERAKALQDYHAARKQLALTFIKHALLPTIVIGLFIASWQAALLVIVVLAAIAVFRAINSDDKPCIFKPAEPAKENLLSPDSVLV